MGRRFFPQQGIPTSSLLWRGVIPQLARSCRVIAPHMLNSGQLGKPLRAAVPIAAQARILLGLLDAIGLACADLAAHDIGGGETGKAALFRDFRRPGPEYTLAIARALELLGLPVLVLWGGRDPFQNTAFTQRLRDAIPNARLEWIAGAVEEQTGNVAARIEAFLAAPRPRHLKDARRKPETMPSDPPIMARTLNPSGDNMNLTDTICIITGGTGQEGGPKGLRTNVICTGFVTAPLVERQISEQASDPGIPAKAAINEVMRGETVNTEFTTVKDVSHTALFLATFASKALTGRGIVVSHGWRMH